MKSALIVESCPTTRRLLLVGLGRSGWQVYAVDQIDQALHLLEQRSIQVVYINEAIDHVSGYRLLAAIHAEQRWRTLRVVVAGNGDTPPNVTCAIELGADG